jgi:hypothetical protein
MPARQSIECETLFIKGIPPNTSRKELFAALSSVEGSPLLFLKLSEPRLHKNFARVGWATYNSKEQAKAVLYAVNGKKVSDLHVRMLQKLQLFT